MAHGTCCHHAHLYHLVLHGAFHEVPIHTLPSLWKPCATLVYFHTTPMLLSLLTCTGPVECMKCHSPQGITDTSAKPLYCFAVVQGWTCTQVFEGHSHYVMQVVFNPKDTNTFASASLDRTVKVGSFGVLLYATASCDIIRLWLYCATVCCSYS